MYSKLRPTPSPLFLIVALLSMAIAFLRPVLASSSLGLDAELISDNATAGAFPLVQNKQASPLLLDKADWPGVLRAARDFQADIQRVTDVKPQFLTGSMPSGKIVIIVGTIGKSTLIDSLVKSGKLDVTGVSGKWESFVVTVIDKPSAGVEQALVIAGSDKRGTIYGIYELSEQLGVSPWYWWADVPSKKRASAYVIAGRYSAGEPAVKYRGIFINDEEPALGSWAREKFGGINSKMYSHMFELILRLRGNYLWPAMWGKAFNEDDTLNPELADEYGIVMGTSHHEPMIRAQKEWTKHRNQFGNGQWNYYTNGDGLKKFWNEGVARNKDYENIISIGMRGDGDEPMTGSNDMGANIALLERIVTDQRQLIADNINRDVTKVPQLWALYKEVADYYQGGMKVPDDVTLLWCDDNWGNNRRLPTEAERKRSGGAGIYYHFDYVGSPRSYKWINTNPLPKIWEQMSMAFDYGADRVWIVNVGDLKPMELPIEFFLRLAWNPRALPKEKITDFTRRWAEREFGPQYAADIADIVAKYAKYNAWRKPELLEPTTFSLVNYQEAERVLADWQAIVTQAETIYKQLPPASRDAFFQLVLYPTKASATVAGLHIMTGFNQLYAKQKRASTNLVAQHVGDLFKQDQNLSDAYHKINGGKWNHMMAQTRIGYTAWNDPKTNIMPKLAKVDVAPTAAMGVGVEGSEAAWPGSTIPAKLPPFDSINRQTHYLEIFKRGSQSFDYTITANQPWVKLGLASGTASSDQRIFVSIDWDKIPSGANEALVTVTCSGTDGDSVPVQISAIRPEKYTRENTKAFGGLTEPIAIIAADAARNIATPNARWEPIPDYGRGPSGLTIFPTTAQSVQPPANSPCLEYPVLIAEAGDVEVALITGPALNVQPDRGVRIAVSFDGEPPQIMDAFASQSFADPSKRGDISAPAIRDWGTWVRDNARTMRSTHTIAEPGVRTLKVWMVDPGVVLEKIIISKGDVRPSYFGPPAASETKLCKVEAASCRFSEPERQDAASTVQAGWVEFASFTYEGRDSVFEKNPPSASQYYNPILAGYYPDPSICRVGKDYYLINSTFSYFPGVPIFHSTDLVNWTQLGHILDRPSQLDVTGQAVSGGIFAPAISFHDGLFYMITTNVGSTGNFYVTAKNPAGPWSDPVKLPRVNGIDPSFFFDDDGRAYIVHNGPPPDDKPLYDGHRAIWLWEFDLKSGATKGEGRIIINGGVDISKKPSWIEGPHLFKRNGYYYICAAEGGTSVNHSQVIFRTKSLSDAFVPWSGNPIMTQRDLDPMRPNPVTSLGHADLVETQNGEWWAVFLGVQPYSGNFYNTGRETFMLPVTWENDWPVILKKGEPLPRVVQRPKLPASPRVGESFSGSFTWRDDFDKNKLDMRWVFLRTPTEKWWSLDAKPGSLLIAPRAVSLSSVSKRDAARNQNPSFIACRQQHTDFSATTKIVISAATAPGDAGIACLQNDANYYFLGVRVGEGGKATEVFLETQTNRSASSEIIARNPLPADIRELEFKVEGFGRNYSFAYRTSSEGRWITLKANADGSILSTQSAGGFVGTCIGMFARAAR